MALICHVILLDHVIKGSFEFIARSLSNLVTILSSLVELDTVVVKI